MHGTTKHILSIRRFNAATGEIADHETLGGAQMHATTTGTGGKRRRRRSHWPRDRPPVATPGQSRAGAGAPTGEEVKAQLATRSEAIEGAMEIAFESIYTSVIMMDDGLIDPRDTRQVLTFCIETHIENDRRITQPNCFGVARLTKSKSLIGGT